MYGKQVREEAIRLREQERLSLGEIQEKLGVSKGTLSVWLRPYPLSETEIHDRLKSNGMKNGRAKKMRQESALHQKFGVPKTNHAKAKTAEAAVLLRAGLLSISTYQSPFDGDKADWVFDVRGTLLKVQVKWATHSKKGGSPFVSLRCSKGRQGFRTYQEGELDVLVGYDFYSDTAYVWTWDEVKHHRRGVACCEDAAENWNKIMAP